MTSEVENILSGEVVRKEGTDKAIGVSSANLMPDEKGEVPLSKQSAFQIEPVQAPLPETTETVGTTEVTEELDLNPAPAVEPVLPSTSVPPVEPTPTVPETPFAAQAPVAPAEPQLEPALDVQTEGEAVQSTETAAAPESDVITEAPVEVAAPTELGTVDFGSVIPSIPLVSDGTLEPAPATTEAPVQENVELPQMPEEIMAEAPTTVNNDLFVDSQPAQAAPTMEAAVSTTPITDTLGAEEPLETLETSSESLNVPEVSPEGDEPVLEGLGEPINEEALFPETQDTVGTIKEESEDAPELPQETEDEALESLDGIPGLDFTSEEPQENLGSVKEEPLELLEEAPVEGVEVAQEGEPAVNYGELTVDSAKLDTIIEKLNNISESLEDIRSKFNVSRNTQILPQEAPVVDQPVTAPIVDAPAQEAPAKQEEFVDALSQIPGYEETGVDETPIKAGMFV